MKIKTHYHDEIEKGMRRSFVIKRFLFGALKIYYINGIHIGNNIQYILLKYIVLHISESGGWFSFFKKGFFWNTSLKFSQRNGYEKYIKLGKYYFSLGRWRKY